MINSIESRLLIDLQNQISAVCPDIKMVDFYTGQDQTDIRPALAYPAALVDIESTDYEDMGTDSQFGTMVVSVRLFLDNYGSALQRAPQKSRDMQCRHFDLEHLLVDAVHGWQPSDGYCQPLVRQSARSENRFDINLRVRTLTFTTGFEDVNLMRKAYL